MENPLVGARRAFGTLFICVSIAVASASVISEIAYVNGLESYYYALIWISTFGIVFGLAAPLLRRLAPSIKKRMRSSFMWPRWAKVLNGACWAGPFAAIIAFPGLYEYLILIGIGLGNLSTYFLIREFSLSSNPEQLIVALVALASIPAAYALDTTIFVLQQDIAIMLSRFFISGAYGAGGTYALLARP